MKLVVCLYHHKHGTDASIYSTTEDAQRSACWIALDYIDDVDDRDKRSRIIQCILDKNFKEALSIYTESTGEAFEILDRMTEDTSEEQLLATANKIKKKQEEAEEDDGHGY